MSNAQLTKNGVNGPLILNIPADSVTAIYSAALDAPPEDSTLPKTGCAVATSFRGYHGYSVRETGREAKAAIDLAAKPKWGKKPRDWVELTCGESDASFFTPGAITGFEEVEVKIPGQDELHRRYRVHIRRHDGQFTEADVDASPANLETLNKAAENKD